MAIPWKALLTTAMILSAVEAHKKSEAPEGTGAPGLTSEIARIETQYIRTVVDCAYWAVAVTQFTESGSSGAFGRSWGFFLQDGADPDQSWCANMTEAAVSPDGSSGGLEARNIAVDTGVSVFAVYFWKVKGTEFVHSSNSTLKASLAAAGEEVIRSGVNLLEADSIADEVLAIANQSNGTSLAAVSAATSNATKTLAIENPDKLPLVRVEVGDKEITLLALPK